MAVPWLSAAARAKDLLPADERAAAARAWQPPPEPAGLTDDQRARLAGFRGRAAHHLADVVELAHGMQRMVAPGLPTALRRPAAIVARA